DKKFKINELNVEELYYQINNNEMNSVVSNLLTYKSKLNLNDWIFYQLVRKTANLLCTKKDNYNTYTFYKWFLMSKSGYDTKLVFDKGKPLLYIRSDENVYDIPYFNLGNKQYICLNYHDFKIINFQKEKLHAIDIVIAESQKPFSYKITQMPNFSPNTYIEKDLSFQYKEKTYHFKVKLNDQVQQIFKNYPVVDFESYFNIPLSNETYSSLIPFLKINIQNLTQKEGIDYLMHFTRYAFLYENDQENFGKEKRMTPEQTLLFEHSDCDDRASLFFYLVKEIYNLPMIAVLYPTHITIAVQFEKPEGKPIEFNGRKFSICDPTPQKDDLLIGQISSELSKTAFQVVYEYIPTSK
ncbi:MAG: hypothetical protein K9G64_08045, partial [Bacteroidia bacterium]|nr:hypothetical protein [Bacteroidia bacterium]